MYLCCKQFPDDNGKTVNICPLIVGLKVNNLSKGNTKINVVSRRMPTQIALSSTLSNQFRGLHMLVVPMPYIHVNH
jgi:hypothetical protein